MMDDRQFHLKLKSTYYSDNNTIDDLSIDIFDKNSWQPLTLDIKSPGFLLFINGLFSCQHLYMRLNSAERNLILTSATGELQVVAGEFWDIKTIMISFYAHLRSGIPTQEDISYITDRMLHCPVSTNLPPNININNSVNFVNDS